MSFKGTKYYEGLRLTAYRCSAGFLTIGYGHNIDAHGDYNILDKNNSITQGEADQLYIDDMDKVIKDVKKLFPDSYMYPSLVKDILCDLVFNMGIGTFSKFTNTIAMFKLQDWHSAANYLIQSKWYKQVGNRSKDIVASLKGI